MEATFKSGPSESDTQNLLLESQAATVAPGDTIRSPARPKEATRGQSHRLRVLEETYRERQRTE